MSDRSLSDGGGDCEKIQFPDEYNFVTWGDDSQGCYLRELAALERYLSSETNKDDIFEINSRILELRAMMGDDLFVLKKLSERSGPENANLLERLNSDQFEKADGRTEILKLASEVNVVVINEAHYMSKHRWFVKSLIRGLADRNYSVFASEALDISMGKSMNAELLMSPILLDGYYTRDPQYGNLIRSALHNGFRVFAYEPSAADISAFADADNFQTAREVLQARNIARLVDDLAPGQKLLVLAGFDHIKEGEKSASSSKTRRMASYLAGLIDQEILTVDQVGADLSADTTRPDGKCLAGSDNSGHPIVLKTGGELVGLGRYKDEVDVTVIHRCTELVFGRAGWRSAGNDIIPIYPDCPQGDPGLRMLAQAHVEGESRKAVPIDQVIVDQNNPVPLLVTEGEKVFVVCEVY